MKELDGLMVAVQPETKRVVSRLSCVTESRNAPGGSFNSDRLARASGGPDRFAGAVAHPPSPSGAPARPEGRRCPSRLILAKRAGTGRSCQTPNEGRRPPPHRSRAALDGWQRCHEARARGACPGACRSRHMPVAKRNDLDRSRWRVTNPLHHGGQRALRSTNPQAVPWTAPGERAGLTSGRERLQMGHRASSTECPEGRNRRHVHSAGTGLALLPVVDRLS